MKTIKILDNSPMSILLFNSMMNNEITGKELLNIFFGGNRDLMRGDDTTVDVQILINGVEVDVTEQFENYIVSCVERMNEHIESKARELIKEKINDVIESLCDIETKVEYINLQVENK